MYTNQNIQKARHIINNWIYPSNEIVEVIPT